MCVHVRIGVCTCEDRYVIGVCTCDEIGVCTCVTICGAGNCVCGLFDIFLPCDCHVEMTAG